MNQDPFVGKLIDGRYEIQARIGEGGMGVVYKARQTTIDRVIALKMLNAQVAGDPTWVQRFANEARACSRLQHPNTIRMFDFGQTPDGRLFMTMEFLDGVSLRDGLAKGPLAPHRVVKILNQCCASLAEAHSIGIIHRDIKPDNVFLLNMAGQPDFVKLLDFSVAKLLEGDRMKTQAGVVFGTPQYMSPEQGRGLPLDARSDLYALGILAFEMLTGAVPFHDDNPMTVIQMHLHATVPPLPQSVPYSVQQIVRRALEKEPSRRYQSSGEMMQHCQQVFAELTQGNMQTALGPQGLGAQKTMLASGPPGMPSPQQMPQMHPQMQQQMPPRMQGGPPGMPPMQGPPGMPPQMQGPPGMPPQMPMQSHQQATMIAQPSPFAQGVPQGMPQGGMTQPGQQGQGGFQPASPMQKTIVAMAAPQLGQMQPGQPPPGYPPMNSMAPNAASSPNKTVMLQGSEGVVSVARTGQAVQPVGTGAVEQGASTLFWIVSLVIGVAVGALAYVIVLQL
ncbi:MAG TPA: serine/threonine-protein kinase [Kofleriaceae bacterium]|nr:serine/threonine-protein kinase [Kofleriaceae bacterium]